MNGVITLFLNVIFWVKSVGQNTTLPELTQPPLNSPRFPKSVQVIPADLEAFDPEYFSNLKWSGWTQPVWGEIHELWVGDIPWNPW